MMKDRTVRIATHTLEAIERALTADQGAQYRTVMGQIMRHMDDAFRGEDEGHRSHMGASILGKECARAIWMTFHWTTKENFTGRILRLFQRGHLEEARFLALLHIIGVQLYFRDADGNQYRIKDADGHIGGSGDGIGVGVPDLPSGTAAVLEFKTHSDKSFLKLVQEGVRSSKFEHYIQMQIYMRKMGIPAALYMAANKNTDDLYAEIIHLEPELADEFLGRGNKLVYMPDAPKRLNDSPGFWKCRFCNHRPVCHLKAAPDVNCRSCVHAKPAPQDGLGQWHCTRYDWLITKDVIKVGCEKYQAIRFDD